MVTRAGLGYFRFRNTSFCKTQRVQRTFFLKRNALCAFRTRFENHDQFQPVMRDRLAEAESRVRARGDSDSFQIPHRIILQNPVGR